ncbi:MAG: UDP binding domain-containing protein [Myxococcota bacterium]
MWCNASLGLAYKRDVDDSRESPAFRIIELLLNAGARVRYHDPYIPRMPPKRDYTFEMTSTELSPSVLAGTDGVLVVTDHRAVDYQRVADHASLIVDTRNVMAGVDTSKTTVLKA